jgi:hypothetical protein
MMSASKSGNELGRTNGMWNNSNSRPLEVITSQNDRTRSLVFDGGSGAYLHFEGSGELTMHMFARFPLAMGWGEGSFLVPPERWVHQHCNVGPGRARYLALKPFNSRKCPGLQKLGSSESVKAGGDQIEYEDEDPLIRKMFEEELAKRGVESRMQEIPKAYIGYL